MFTTVHCLLDPDRRLIACSLVININTHCNFVAPLACKSLICLIRSLRCEDEAGTRRFCWQLSTFVWTSSWTCLRKNWNINMVLHGATSEEDGTTRTTLILISMSHYKISNPQQSGHTCRNNYYNKHKKLKIYKRLKMFSGFWATGIEQV